MQSQDRAVRLVIIGLVVLVAATLTYFAWTLLSPIDLPFQRVDKSMQMTSRVDGRTLRVTGTTDLPDGAFIDWYLWRDPNGNGDWPSGHATVQSGAFSIDADLAGLPAGRATADVSFSCDWGSTQPKQVTDIVGEHCEHLAGEQVYVDSPGDPKQLAVPIGFTVP